MSNSIHLQQPTTTISGSGSYTRIPLNMGYDISCDGKVGCPRRIYNEPCNVPSCVRPCNVQAPTEVFYNLNQQVDYNCLPDVSYPPTCYDTSSGYPAVAVEIPNTMYSIYSGTGIYLEQLEAGVRINNGGVIAVNVQGEVGSGIIVTNQNTRSNPNFVISVSPVDLVAKAGLAKSIVFNGQTYDAFNGVITINSGLVGGAITNINSPAGTLVIAPSSVGAVNIEVKPVKVNGSNLSYDANGSLLNLVSGLNTTVSSTGTNSAQINVPNNAFVKTINSISPDLNGNAIVSPISIFKQATRVLTAGDITSLTTAGFDLLSTPTLGSVPSSITATDGIMLFQNGTLISLEKYTRASSLIVTTGVSWTVGNILTWIVIKSS